MTKLKLIFQLFLFTFLVTFAQEGRNVVDVPKVDSPEITFDGIADEAAWGDAATVEIITSTGYEIWANKYYRENIPEPEFDELYVKLMYTTDTLYVFVRIDEFVNDSTDLFWPGQWGGDQLFVSLSSRLGLEMNGWYDGNAYAAPEGPYHYLVLEDQVSLNNNAEMYIPEEWRSCDADSFMVLNAADHAQWGVYIDTETGEWNVEMAISNPHVAAQSSIAFNVGGSTGSTAFGEAFFEQEGYYDAYGYWTWQPSVPNDPWAIAGESDPGLHNLASSAQWAMLNFLPGAEDVERVELSVPHIGDGEIVLDGVMDEAVWDAAATTDIITSTGYNIWANKYYREDIPEPEYDEIQTKLLYKTDTLYVFMRIDEFVNDSTDLFWPGQWGGDQLFISISARLAMEMNGWYDGNAYAAPEGPYHYLVLEEDVSLNNHAEMYIPEEWRVDCGADSFKVLNSSDHASWGVYVNTETGEWNVEMAISNPNVAPQAKVGFNVGGSTGSTAFGEAFFEQEGYYDAYGYWTWQPSVPNDPWAIAGESDPGLHNLASSARWAVLTFEDGEPTGIRQDEEISSVPADFSLEQNYPNPFNPSTTIRFNLEKSHRISLNIYNVLGETVEQLIVNQDFNAGSYSVDWNAANLPSGVYFYELRSENRQLSRKMLLLK